MTGGTAAHSAIQTNLAITIGGRLRGKPCRFYGSDLKIEVAGHIRYPDGFVVYSPAPNAATVVRDPVIIFEILSPSTSSTDRIIKNREYEATPSVKHYVSGLAYIDAVGAGRLTPASADARRAARLPPNGHHGLLNPAGEDDIELGAGCE